MKIKLIDSGIQQPLNDGTYAKAMGGTELMKLGLTSRVPKSLLDKFQIICSRVREIDPDKKAILWLHDTWDDPENEHLRNPSSLDRFEKLVFVSNYQFQTYHQAYGIPYGKSVVLKNAAEPFPEFEKPTDKVNLIYHTTPHRGLEILIPVFVNYIAKKYPNVHLHVYSSFDIYGWPQRNAPYEVLFEICRNHPQITYHGSVSNSEVRTALQNSHIFAYPSIWPETSCIAAIEAMMAGVAIVTSDFGALPETTLGSAIMYRFNEDKNAHISIFIQALESAIQKTLSGELRNHLTFYKNYSIMNYSWENRIPQWIELLESLS